ncbi:alpha/beta hydrolase [Gorillibacterium sp. CAU 1737]|uniref:alpha/beta fold hydrolase n=1 Tax=Gorillibacterium sp. CAU 1737 TaxID=3140362 RepID=UPI003260E01E
MTTVFRSEEGRDKVWTSYDRLLEQWGVPIEERDLPTSFGTTHVLLAGDPAHPPLLLFHGVGDNSALMWVFNARGLAKDFRLIAVDTLGGPGKSIPNDLYFQKMNDVAWIDELADALGLHRFHVAGVSNGAYLAALYTAKRPSRADRAVCMAGGLERSLLRMLRLFLPEALFPGESSTRRLLHKMCGTNTAVFEENEDLMRHWGLLLKHFNPRSMMSHPYLPLNTEENVAILRQKASFIMGSKDPLSHYPKALASLERAELRYQVIEGAGHSVNHEQHEVVNTLMREWLMKGAVPGLASDLLGHTENTEHAESQ